MSEEGDIDVESAEEVPDIAGEATAMTVEDSTEVYRSRSGNFDKRAHHNALERRRRDHIKDSFHGLRDSIPAMQGEKVSRAHILNKATEYIRLMQKGGSTRENDIAALKRRNEVLEEQVRELEGARSLGSVESADEILAAVAEKVEKRQRHEKLNHVPQHTVKTVKVGGTKRERNSKQTGTNKHINKGSTSSGVNQESNAAGTTAASGSTTSSRDTGSNSNASDVSVNQLSNNINLLAKNQSLLSALQKNLSSPNLPANIKSLAARVLASPLVNTGGALRGVVTATTVPKGSSFISSPLPNTSTSLPQQQAHKSSSATPSNNANSAQTNNKTRNKSSPLLLPKQPESATRSSSLKTSQISQGPEDSSSDQSCGEIEVDDKSTIDTPQVPNSSISQNLKDSSSKITTPHPSSVSPTLLPPTAATSSSALSATNTSTNCDNAGINGSSTNNLAMASIPPQVLDASTLLQQQGAGILLQPSSTTSPSSATANDLLGAAILGGVSGTPCPLLPNITPELLAQVSSFLNIPSASPPLSTNDKECDVDVEGSATGETHQGTKRPSSMQDPDGTAEPPSKKQHTET